MFLRLTFSKAKSCMRKPVLTASRGLLLLLTLLVTPGIHAELTASVDVTEMTTEQSFNFTLSTTQGSGNPDFSVLQNDFEILGNSTFSQTQNHNGKIIQNLSWRLQLLPKRVGQFTIPAFTVAGERSEPIDITVTAPRAVTGSDFGDFHVDVTVDNVAPYVQSQVIYTIRVYHAVNFLDGSLSAPEVPGLEVESLGEDRVYQENRNGRVYRVLERRFALFPQTSGTLSIPGVVLNANVAASGGNRGIFAPRQPVRRRSADIELTVKPRPPSDQASWWLPAASVQVGAHWEGDAQAFYVGESVTRTLILQAQGVASTALPELSVPEDAAFRIYADQPELTQQATARGLVARRLEKWAVVPQAVGPLTLPGITVPWFNTTTNQFEQAVLPETVVQVQPSRNAVTDQNTQPNNNTTGTAAVSAAPSLETPTDSLTQSVVGQSSGTGEYWRALALLALAGWVVTLLAWWRSRRRPQDNAATTARTANAVPDFKSLEMASRSGDVRGFADALVRWARGLWQDNPPGSLVTVAQRLEHQVNAGSLAVDRQAPALELARDLRALDASLYAGADAADTPSTTISAQQILQKLRQYADTREGQKISGNRSALPDL